jgi:hypothetical protein
MDIDTALPVPQKCVDMLARMRITDPEGCADAVSPCNRDFPKQSNVSKQYSVYVKT